MDGEEWFVPTHLVMAPMACLATRGMAREFTCHVITSSTQRRRQSLVLSSAEAGCSSSGVVSSVPPPPSLLLTYLEVQRLADAQCGGQGVEGQPVGVLEEHHPLLARRQPLAGCACVTDTYTGPASGHAA